jgi:Fe-S-cluster containining protein
LGNQWKSDMIAIPSEKEIQFLPRLKSPFRFRCVACGECCGSFTIILSPYDIFRLRKATGLRTRQLIDGNFIAIRRESFRATFGFAPIVDFLNAFGLARDDTVPVAVLQFHQIASGKEECLFLGESFEDKRLCRIYEDRPTMCRLHPLGCITMSGRRRWFFRKPKCDASDGKEQTVEEWISSSQASPFLSANANFLRWMRALLGPTTGFSSLRESQRQMVERILYDFDSLPEAGEQATWRSIARRFRQWSDLEKKNRGDFPC